MDRPDDLAPPAEAPVSLDPRPPAPDSVRAAAQTFERLITESPAEPTTSTTSSPTSSPATTSTPAAPRVDLATPEGRIYASLAEGVTIFSPADVEAVRDRIDAADYHALQAQALATQTRNATVTTFHTQQLDRLAARVPEAVDPSTRQQFTDELESYAKQFDFTAQDVHAVVDARTIELAADGMKARKRVRQLERELANERVGGAEARPRASRSSRSTVELPPRLGIHDAARLLTHLYDDQ